ELASSTQPATPSCAAVLLAAFTPATVDCARKFKLHRHRVASWLSSTRLQPSSLQDPADRTLRFSLYLHARLRRRQADVELARFRVLLIVPVGTGSSCFRPERGHDGYLSSQQRRT